MKINKKGVASNYSGTRSKYTGDGRAIREGMKIDKKGVASNYQGIRSKYIPLSGKYGEGKVTRIAPEDEDHMMFFSNGEPWTYSGASGKNITADSKGHYVKKQIIDPDGNKVYEQLHTWIMNAPPGKLVDHINSDTLDNHRYLNLRITDDVGNSHNRESNAKSGIRGVEDLKNGKARATLIVRGEKKLSKTFSTREEATEALRQARIENDIFLHESKVKSRSQGP